MKKKIICIIVAVVSLIVVILAVIHMSSINKLGNITQDYAEKTTVTSTISFDGEAGDRVKFRFSSDLKSGILDVILYDSKGNEVYELDYAKELVTYFTLEQADEYTLKAECTDFIGKYSVTIYREE